MKTKRVSYNGLNACSKCYYCPQTFQKCEAPKPCFIVLKNNTIKNYIFIKVSK